MCSGGEWARRGWPRLGLQPARWPWLVPQQRHQDGAPAPAKDADQGQARRPALEAWRVQQRRHIEHRAADDGVFGHPTHAHQPQGRHDDHQPQSRCPRRIPHAGALPLPNAAFGQLETLLDPGVQALPGRRAGDRRQIGHQQPPLCLPGFPAGQQRAVQGGRLERGTGTLPAGARLGGEGGQPVPARSATRAEPPPVLIRSSGCHPRWTMSRNNQRAYTPRSASTMTVMVAITMACGRLKCGNWVATSCVQCATLGGDAMASLLTALDWWLILGMPPGRAPSHRLFLKNLPL